MSNYGYSNVSEGPVLKFYRKIPKPWSVEYREAVRNKAKFIRVLDSAGDFIKQQSDLINNQNLSSDQLFLRRNLKKCLNKWSEYNLRFITLKKARKMHLNNQITPKELAKQENILLIKNNYENPIEKCEYKGSKYEEELLRSFYSYYFINHLRLNDSNWDISQQNDIYFSSLREIAASDLVKTKLLKPLPDDLSFKIYYSHRGLSERTLLTLQRWHQAQTINHFKSINDSPLQYWCRCVIQIRILQKINNSHCSIKNGDDFDERLNLANSSQDPMSIGAPLNFHDIMPPLSSQELAGVTPRLTINSQQSSQRSNSSNSLMRLSQENQFDSSLYYPLINNEALRQPLSSKQQQLSELNPLQIIQKNSIERTPLCSINNSLSPQMNFKTPEIPIRLSTIKKRADQFTPSDFNQYRRSSPRLASLKNSSLTSSISSTSNVVNKRKRSFDGIDLGSPLCASTPIVRKNVRK